MAWDDLGTPTITLPDGPVAMSGAAAERDDSNLASPIGQEISPPTAIIAGQPAAETVPPLQVPALNLRASGIVPPPPPEVAEEEKEEEEEVLVVQTARVPSVADKMTAAARARRYDRPPADGSQTARAWVPERAKAPSVASKHTARSRLLAAAASEPEARPTTAPTRSSRGVTKPRSPALTTRSRADVKGSVGASEELEMLRAEREVREQRRRREKWRSQLGSVLAETGTKLPSRSTARLTVPVEFDLATDARSTRSAPATPTGSPVNVRASAPADLLAEQLSAFAKTPKRFRSRASGAVFEPPLTDSFPTSYADDKPSPRPFSAAAAGRARPKPKSTVELVVEAIAAIPKFKAKPLNPKVMASGASAGDLGVPRVQRAKPTQTKGFRLTTDARGERSRAEMAGSASAPTNRPFKARPLSARVMSGEAANVPASTPRRSTRPQSPNLSTRARGELRVSEVAPVDEPFAAFKARPMPAYSPAASPREASAASLPTTSPKPFALKTAVRREVAEHARKAKREAEAEAARAAREFRAKPMPVGEAWAPSLSKAKDPVEPAPFDLSTEKRGAVKELEREVKLRNEAAAAAAAREVTARAHPKTPPFVPAKSIKPLTEISGFQARERRGHSPRPTPREPYASARLPLTRGVTPRAAHVRRARLTGAPSSARRTTRARRRAARQNRRRSASSRSRGSRRSRRSSPGATPHSPRRLPRLRSP